MRRACGKGAAAAAALAAVGAALLPTEWVAGPRGVAVPRSAWHNASAPVLTAEQQRTYEEEGFVILRGAIPADWVDALRGAVDTEMAASSTSRWLTNELFQWALYGSPWKGPYQYRGINRWKSSDAVRDFVFRSPAPHLAQAAMQSDTVHVMEDLMFIKTPEQGGMSTGWHRDTNYPVPTATTHQMTTWIPLDDVPLHEQSGVQVLAGSHRWNFSECGYHYFKKECIEERQHLVRGEDVAPGDVLLFHGNIGHRTVPAPGGRLARRRAAVAIRWGGDDAVFQRKMYGFKTFNWYDFWPHGLQNGDPIGNSPHFQRVLPAGSVDDCARAKGQLAPTLLSIVRFLFGRFVMSNEQTAVEAANNLAAVSGGALGGAKSIY